MPPIAKTASAEARKRKSGKTRRKAGKTEVARKPRVPASDRRQQLIQATIRVMRRSGVRSVTMRAVAAEADASLAAVHYCFEDKKTLLQEAIRCWLNLLTGDALSLAGEPGIGASVRQIVRTWWDWLEANRDDVIAQFELALWAVRSEENGDLASTIYPLYVSEFTAILERSADAAGEASRWRLERLSRALLSIIDGCSLQHLSDPTSDARALCEELAENLIDRVVIRAASGTVPATAGAE